METILQSQNKKERDRNEIIKKITMSLQVSLETIESSVLPTNLKGAKSAPQIHIEENHETVIKRASIQGGQGSIPKKDDIISCSSSLLRTKKYPESDAEDKVERESNPDNERGMDSEDKTVQSNSAKRECQMKLKEKQDDESWTSITDNPSITNIAKVTILDSEANETACSRDKVDKNDSVRNFIGESLSVLGVVVGGLASIVKSGKEEEQNYIHSSYSKSSHPSSSVVIEELEDDKDE